MERGWHLKTRAGRVATLGGRMKVIQVLEAAALIVRRGMAVFLVLLFAAMLTLVLAQIAGRYLFGYSVGFATELSTFLQVWLVLFGAGVAVAKSHHIAIDIVPSLLPLPLARALLLIIVALSIAFLVVLIVGTLPMMRIGQTQTSPVMQIPMSLAYVSLIVGSAYVVLELLLSLISRWSNPFAPPSVEQDGGGS